MSTGQLAMVLPTLVHGSARGLLTPHTLHLLLLIASSYPFGFSCDRRTSCPRPVGKSKSAPTENALCTPTNRNRGMFPKMVDVLPLPGSGARASTIVERADSIDGPRRVCQLRSRTRARFRFVVLITIEAFGETFGHDSWKQMYYGTQSCGATRTYRIWAQPGVPTARPQSARAWIESGVPYSVVPRDVRTGANAS